MPNISEEADYIHRTPDKSEKILQGRMFPYPAMKWLRSAIQYSNGQFFFTPNQFRPCNNAHELRSKNSDVRQTLSSGRVYMAASLNNVCVMVPQVTVLASKQFSVTGNLHQNSQKNRPKTWSHVFFSKTCKSLYIILSSKLKPTHIVLLYFQNSCNKKGDR